MPKPHDDPGRDAHFLGEIQKTVKKTPASKTPLLKGANFSPSGSHSLGHWLALLGRDVDLYQAEFHGDAWITDEHVAHTVHLRRATFHQDLVLARSELDGGIDLQGITASGKVWIENCVLKRGVGLIGATVHGSMNCMQCRIAEGLLLALTKFQGNFFVSNLNSSRLSLRDARLSGDAQIRNVEVEECDLSNVEVGPNMRLTLQESRLSKLEAENVLVRDKGTVTLEKVNLDGASFLRSDVSEWVLREVTWAKAKDGRRRLAGETTLPTHARAALADNYRQLVINHEAARDFEAAEEFHVGEMEMRRMARGPINVYTLYSLLSKYGTSYWRASWCLLAEFVLFVLASLWAGFLPTGTSPVTSSTEVIEYRLPDQNHVAPTISQLLSDIWSASILVAEAATFQRDRGFTPASRAGRAVVVLATIVLPAQVALLLFALRRRFRR